MENICGYLKAKCDCGQYFGNEQKTNSCSNCGEERKPCKKPKPFKWVTDPDSGKQVNTGERHNHCFFHSNRKPEVGATSKRTKDKVEQSSLASPYGRTDEEVKEKFLEKHGDKFIKTQTGFTPILPKDSEFLNVWQVHVDNQQMTNLRGEVALLRTYLQYNVQEHEDYPEQKDVRLSQRLIQQITTTITNITELETKLQALVKLTDVRNMVENIISIIASSDIPDQYKYKLAKEIEMATNNQ